jgi:hypothetical protein
MLDRHKFCDVTILDPRSFSRGKRGIAGTLVFTVFDRNALLTVFKGMSDKSGWFFAHDTDVAKHTNDEEKASQVALDVNTDNSWQPAWYTDQIPPFDVVLTAANFLAHISEMIHDNSEYAGNSREIARQSAGIGCKASPQRLPRSILQRMIV